MAPHQPFGFGSLDELIHAVREMGLEIPMQEDLSPLFNPARIGDIAVPNRLAVHPMEGADATPDGAPSEMTLRRYRRFAGGGHGLIWFEAAAVVPAGRSNPHQLMITPDNAPAFRLLVDETRQAARKSWGDKHDILCVLQLTHAGRYSRPQGRPRPQVACRSPHLDQKRTGLHVLSDQELDRLQADFQNAARLARKAGFDAVDIKSCHGYLLNELLAGYRRPHSRYGCELENRTRFLVEVISRIHAEEPKLLLTARLSAFDGIPYPFGFGYNRNPPPAIDLTEVKILSRKLLSLGCRLLSFSAGNPHVKPHVGRPYDRPAAGGALPDEHPLEGVQRLLSITAELQSNFPSIPVVGTGYSWLRQYFPFVAAAVLERGEASLIGLGRSAFAYPEAPRDLMERGTLDPKRVCITCSKCSELLRRGWNTGCVVRDSEIYAESYQRLESVPA
jgi:2,4-dienoyl-CoA reductase-like NADH-dependent reductase (Old Yellow Enzyme family)